MDDRALARVVRNTVDKCIPFVVHVELTWKCNLACCHCYLPPGGISELTLEQWSQIFAELKRQGTLFVAISGGEPFLRDDLFGILKSVRQSGLALRLLTNGTMIGAKEATQLKELCPAAVEVSLLGGNASTYEEITGVTGSFQKLRDGLVHLKNNGVRTILKIPVMRANWREFDAMKQIASELDMKVRYDVCISPRTDGDKTPTEQRLTAKELAAFLEEQSPSPGKLEIPTINADAVPCGAGQNAFSISPDGTVHPCTALRMPLGNVLTTSWAEIKAYPSLKKLRKLRFGELEECASCARAPLCGRCPGVALIETGRVDGPSPSACALGDILAKLLSLPR